MEKKDEEARVFTPQPHPSRPAIALQHQLTLCLEAQIPCATGEHSPEMAEDLHI